ncbi:dehydrogenase/reductase SDR family member 7-like [Mercenaria mercenaria]|uniref:dehydrogenase/reductase SDR family member 7-like n=1 Tax=Mercenaria mercenaria TaxID=6596 RepID=UPI00234F08BA|nr:dehydrogenase/reductase SDR family member 7-like [Mercenaria mercenaria]XP_053376870.1 dehydrogenase/reductase SDR family member 7-like [Mercenaria mercenaria]XP_053376874.1 dehydrogenase/reductase SDR family member 7-like [Mercenaria mercenaria]
MDWCTIVEVAVVAYIVLQLVRLLFADCDLQLQWTDKFGRSTGVLTRKVVWITGASSGIGEYLSYELAKAGCRLVLSARREGELQRVKKECLSYGTLMDDDILVLPLDMLKFDLHQPAVDEVLSRFKQIDVLVNNAGRSQRAQWEKTDLQVDRDMLEINVLSVLSLTKLVLPHMLERKEGHIVNMSSVSGKLGSPLSGSYTGAKHALQGWFDCLRVEMFPRNITVTNICPGPVFSNLLKGSFTENSGELLGVEMKEGEKRMNTRRCARLCAVAIANKLDEVWIALQPILLFVYIGQYMPTIAGWCFKRAGVKFMMKFREGQH